jgi:hypothetical protein
MSRIVNRESLVANRALFVGTETAIIETEFTIHDSRFTIYDTQFTKENFRCPQASRQTLIASIKMLYSIIGFREFPERLTSTKIAL